MPETPRCQNCYYVLDGLPSDRCPECGRAFDLADPTTFTTKPMFVWWKYWLPGFLLSIGVGIVLYLIVAALEGWGFAATLMVPFSFGSILGYSCRVRKALLILLAIAAVILVGAGVYTLNLAGPFCTLVLIGVAAGPAIIGMVFGQMLRYRLKKSKFSQRSYLPVLLLILLPVIWGDIEGQSHRHYAVETVTTTAIFDVPPDKAWDSVQFYEEVHLDPPLLLRLGLPRPLYAKGSSMKVGDVKVCIYSKGRLAKRITQVDPGHLLAFEVVTQRNIEDHDVRLTTGSFAFEPIGEHQTRVTLTTSYEPMLGPRWAWRPFEKLAVHTLHEQVLRGMSQSAGHTKAQP